MKRKERQEEVAKSNDYQGFYDELERETDRGAALLAGALIDNFLAALLEAFFIETPPTKKGAPTEVEKLLYEPNAPLGTFSSRATTAYCLGLISYEDFKDIYLIKDIRNHFAHRLQGYSFSTPSILQKCKRLSITQHLKPSIPIPAFDEPRSLFEMAVAAHAVRLEIKRLEVAAKQKRKSPDAKIIQVVQV